MSNQQDQKVKCFECKKDVIATCDQGCCKKCHDEHKCNHKNYGP